MQSRFAAELFARGGSEGMAAYRGNVFGNWSRALAGTYPIVRKVVGEEFFRALAREYARAHPSRSGDLNQYGERFADFVAAFEHTQDLPYLPDVARMEWLAHRAHYAPDPAPLNLEGLGEPSRLRLTPPCALLASDWPLGSLWTVHQDDYEGEVNVDLRAGPDRILVHRPRWRVLVRSLAPGEYRFLQAAAQGETLGDALEAAAAEDAEFQPSLALAGWVDAGVIAL